MDDAVRHSHYALCEYLKSKGAVLSAKVDTSPGALCDAASKNDIPALRAILDAGGDMNAGDYDRRTALHLAAAEGRVAVVMKLCEHGADIRFRDRWGHDAIDAATGGGHADLVAQLHLLEKH